MFKSGYGRAGAGKLMFILGLKEVTLGKNQCLINTYFLNK